MTVWMWRWMTVEQRSEAMKSCLNARLPSMQARAHQIADFQADAVLGLRDPATNLVFIDFGNGHWECYSALWPDMLARGVKLGKEQP